MCMVFFFTVFMLLSRSHSNNVIRCSQNKFLGTASVSVCVSQMDFENILSKNGIMDQGVVTGY